MKKMVVLILLISSFNTIAQKADVRVEIFDLKEDVKKLQSENQRLSNDLSISSTKYENRILDLGAKIEDLKFELNVLKRIVEQYRNTVSDNSNSTSSPKTSTTEENVVEKQ